MLRCPGSSRRRSPVLIARLVAIDRADRVDQTDAVNVQQANPRFSLPTLPRPVAALFATLGRGFHHITVLGLLTAKKKSDTED